jgi:hypothetical protein
MNPRKNLFEFFHSLLFLPPVLICLISCFCLTVTSGQPKSNDRTYDGKLSNVTVSVSIGSEPREIIPFDADWRFWLGDDPGARLLGFDDTSWRTLNIPQSTPLRLAKAMEASFRMASPGTGKNLHFPIPLKRSL